MPLTAAGRRAPRSFEPLAPSAIRGPEMVEKMTVRAQDFQVVRTVVTSIPVPMVDVKNGRLFVPSAAIAPGRNISEIEPDIASVADHLLTTANRAESLRRVPAKPFVFPFAKIALSKEISAPFRPTIKTFYRAISGGLVPLGLEGLVACRALTRGGAVATQLRRAGFATGAATERAVPGERSAADAAGAGMNHLPVMPRARRTVAVNGRRTRND